MQAIKCPHCNTQFELTETIQKQVIEQVTRQEREKFQIELDKIKLQEKENIEKKVTEELALQLKDFENEKKEDRERKEKLMQNLLQANEQLRLLKQKEEERELENQKKLFEETKKIQEQVSKQEEEKTKFKLLEKEQQLEAMKKTIEELQRKSEQTSQQMQGEVLELELEQELRREFSQDVIEPVGKGITGSDIRQIVKTPLGNTCGVILWECKRTKAWQDVWITKLKDDLRNEKADVPIIVSTTLPAAAKNGIGFMNGVYICNFNLALILAHLIRKSLHDVARQKAYATHKDEKAGSIYTYITGIEFKQQIEVLVEVYLESKQQLDREKAILQSSWKKREAQLERYFKSAANIYGTIQGLSGGTMPQIKDLEVLEIESSGGKLPL